MNVPLRRTCKEAAALMSQRRDRELPLTDRVALRMHLLVCKACPTFDRQMQLMDQAMQRWRHYRDDAL